MGWIARSGYLSEAEMSNNANIIIGYYRSRGVHDATIAALLGNMQAESTINPQLTEVGGGGGYGLVQWTPRSDLVNACATLGLSPYTSGDVQLRVVLAEAQNQSGLAQWYSSSAFISNYYSSGATSDMIGKTGTQFLQNSMGWSASKLAILFMACYERPSYNPGTNHYDRRMQYANAWYSKLGGGSSTNIVETAVTWAIGIANDNSHGYDQGRRDGPDYDCSSLLSWAYYKAGLNTRPGYTPATGTMYNVFTNVGFQDVTGSVNRSNGSGMIRGDVLLKPGNHTAMHIGNGQVVQASQNEFGGITGGRPGDQTGKEIWVGPYYNYPWTYVLRYPESSVPTKNVALVRWIPG